MEERASCELPLASNPGTDGGSGLGLSLQAMLRVVMRDVQGWVEGTLIQLFQETMWLCL